MNFTSNALEYDYDLFINTLISVLSSEKYKMLKDNNIDTIIKYIKYFGKIENNLKTLLNDIVNIQKGIGTDCLIQYEMKIAIYERKQKLELK